MVDLTGRRASTNIDDRQINEANAIREATTLNDGRLIDQTAFKYNELDSGGMIPDLIDPTAMEDQAPSEFEQLDEMEILLRSLPPTPDEISRAAELPRGSEFVAGDPGGLTRVGNIPLDKRPERVQIIAIDDEFALGDPNQDGNYGTFDSIENARAYAQRLLIDEENVPASDWPVGKVAPKKSSQGARLRIPPKPSMDSLRLFNERSKK